MRFKGWAEKPGTDRRQKGIIETLPQVIHRSCHAVYGKRLTRNAVQHAGFIRPHHMIGVVMGEKNRLHRPDASRQKLCAHIRAGIYQKPLPMIAFDQNRGTAAPIPWLIGVAGAPIAPSIGPANQWHPG
jgi:hypothetical protein